MTRKALGRGLSALLSDTLAQGDELLDIDIDLIDPNPDQPRSRFDETRLEELAQSIRTNGLVQPILLRRIQGARYQIVAGERRWRAAQRAGLHKVSAIVREIPDARLLELALIENIQRQELNPIEEALAFQKLIRDLGLTQDEVAKRVGKDRSSVANYLRLLKLPAQIQRMIEDGSISMGHARALLAIDSEELQLKLANEIVAGKLSVRDIEHRVKKLAEEPKIRESSTAVENDANIRAAELKLKRHFGTQVKIHLGQSKGKIEIDFSSMSELDRIYSIIMRKSEN
ncbi:MAG: ParB/RepB/Spo0J family partition protein [Acidobacteria bacterium]|nr:ParB/RepB/Spo0J family partition protein [Acidobacteriota bacterium]MBK9705681.1 ParB/RepB/Spo0J family partition protein [Acidobacteriota bacterium]